MSICYILDRFPSLTETFVRREIMALKDAGLEIKVFSLNMGAAGAAEPDGIDVERIDRRGFLRISQILARWFARCPVVFLKRACMIPGDLIASPRFAYHRMKGVLNAALAAEMALGRGWHVHAHFAYVSADAAACLAEFLGCRWSVSAHAWDIFTFPGRVLRRRLRGADSVFVCSRHAQEILEGHGIKKTILMRHGIALDDMVTRADVKRGEYVLSVGRLEEKKGFMVLLDALALLAGRGIRLNAKIVGDGGCRGALERRIGELGLKNTVELTGSLGHDDVLRLMRGSFFLVHSGIVAADGDRDGIPNVVVEAMGLGKAVVASAVGGIPELVEDGVDGLLCESGSAESLATAVARLWEDRDLAATLGGKAQVRVCRDFDIRENIKPLLGYLGVCLNESSGVDDAGKKGR